MYITFALGACTTTAPCSIFTCYAGDARIEPMITAITFESMFVIARLANLMRGGIPQKTIDHALTTICFTLK